MAVDVATVRAPDPGEALAKTNPVPLKSPECAFPGHPFAGALPNDLAVVLGELMPYRSTLEGVVVESTFNWYWLVDGLMEAGYRLLDYTDLEPFTNDWLQRRGRHHSTVGRVPLP